MRAVSRDDAPVVIDGNGVEVRLQEIGGGMTTSFIRHVPVALEDCEYVDFSPTEQFAEVIEHIRAQGG